MISFFDSNELKAIRVIWENGRAIMTKNDILASTISLVEKTPFYFDSRLYSNINLN